MNNLDLVALSDVIGYLEAQLDCPVEITTRRESRIRALVVTITVFTKTHQHHLRYAKGFTLPFEGEPPFAQHFIEEAVLALRLAIAEAGDE